MRSSDLLSMTVFDGTELKVNTPSSQPPGATFKRTVSLEIQDTRALCTAPVNPLAIRTNAAQNLANYVVNDLTAATTTWSKTFPNALYYVTPAGLGNCGTGEAPFCAGSENYTGYIPAYLDANQVGGTANGNSTASWTLGSSGGSFSVFDQYQLTDFETNATSSNSLIWFDNCGYGHIYSEGTITGRLSLPPSDIPTNFPVFSYDITNSRKEPVVFAKECCASLYQQTCVVNENGNQVCSLVPPQQIGTSVNDTANSGSGILVGPGDTVTYQTIYSDEVIQAYHAVTGNPLFKMRLKPPRDSVSKAGDATLYACNDPDAKVALSGSNASWSLEIGSSATTALTCTAGNAQGLCPWPMYADTGSGAWSGYTWCTNDDNQHSSFLPEFGTWAGYMLDPNRPVSLMAGGSPGHSGANRSFGKGGGGGGGGSALTVQTGAALAEIPELYVYIGTQTPMTTQGASATIVGKRPLTSLTDAQRQNQTSLSDFLLIAGGGAAGGDGSKNLLVLSTNGGAGGVGGHACANDSANFAQASAAGSSGAQVMVPDPPNPPNYLCTPGSGGNSNGLGAAGGGPTAGTAGIGGESDGTGWLQGGSLVVNQLNTGKGARTVDDGGAGGGGYGGGGGGSACENSGHAGPGGGGGGSFAAKNTAYEPLVPTNANCSAIYGLGFTTGIFQLAYPGEAIAFRGYLSTANHPQPTQCLTASTDNGDLIRSSSNWVLNWGSNGALSLFDDKSTAQFQTQAFGGDAELCFQGSDGNLVINVGNGTPWATGVGGTRLGFDGPCNVEMLGANNLAIWSTNTSCS